MYRDVYGHLRHEDGRRFYSFAGEAEPTPETLRQHAEGIAAWCRDHPETLMSPQPRPLPKPLNFSGGLDARVEYAELAAQVAAGTFRLRVPAESPDGLIAKRCVGICQDPVIPHGAEIWADPRIVPADGDFVLAALPPERCQVMQEYCQRDPALRQFYGDKIAPVMIKRLRALGPDWFLQTNKSSFPLEHCRTLAVVRHIGTADPGYGFGVACAALADE